MLTIKIVNIIKARYVLAFHRVGVLTADQSIVSATKVAHQLEGVSSIDVFIVNRKYAQMRLYRK